MMLLTGYNKNGKPFKYCNVFGGVEINCLTCHNTCDKTAPGTYTCAKCGESFEL
jgi:hypothetical protein